MSLLLCNFDSNGFVELPATLISKLGCHVGNHVKQVGSATAACLIPRVTRCRGYRVACVVPHCKFYYEKYIFKMSTLISLLQIINNIMFDPSPSLMDHGCHSTSTPGLLSLRLLEGESLPGQP